MKTLIICMFLVFTISCSGQNKSATSVFHSYAMNLDSLITTYKTMPTYYVDYGNEDCLFELRINDILVDELTQPGTIGGTSATINPYITRSGKQKVSFKLYPNPDKSMIKSSMNQVYPYYKPFWLEINYIDFKLAEEDQTITDVYKMPPLITPKEGIPYYEFEAEFEAEVPYQIEGSDNCIDLREIPDIEKRVVAEFERVRQLMIEHKFDELKAYFNQRDQELAISMFQTNEMRADDWAETVSNVKKASLSDWQPIEDYRLEFNSDGRSVTLRSKKKKGFPSALLWIKQKENDPKWNAHCFELHLGIKKGTDKFVALP